MNKMHTLTKIILSSIGIFFAIRLLSPLSIGIFYFYSKPSWETAGAWLFSLLLVAGAIGLLVYFLIYRNDKLAKKIIGSEQLPEPDSQIALPQVQWLPVAMRLICIAGGIYFLINVLWHTTYIVNQLAMFKAETYSVNGTTYTRFYTNFAPFNVRSLLPWIIMLVCGVYLLCGAPHFVRWQAKKTLQQCTKNKQQDVA
jgi:multisubunit Na+/H+ antiporter MnhB subunit